MSKIQVTVSTTISMVHTYTMEQALKAYGTTNVAEIKKKELGLFNWEQVAEYARLHTNDSVKVELIKC